MSPSMMMKETFGLGSGSPQCSVGKAGIHLQVFDILYNYKSVCQSCVTSLPDMLNFGPYPRSFGLLDKRLVCDITLD